MIKLLSLVFLLVVIFISVWIRYSNLDIHFSHVNDLVAPLILTFGVEYYYIKKRANLRLKLVLEIKQKMVQTHL